MEFELNSIYRVWLVNGHLFAAKYIGIENGMHQFRSRQGIVSQHLLQEIVASKKVA